jgi:arylsulfatase
MRNAQRQELEMRTRLQLAARRGGLACVSVMLVTLFNGDSRAADPPPNIVLIMADDMGYSDIGCFGGEISTPSLNALAENGLRFTQFYNTARCCPTRASLLTGLYPHQAGVGHMMNDRGFDGYRGDLNRKCRTIAEVLRSAGYSTYMSGKWHVTKKIRPESELDKHNWPLQRGFDRFIGTIHGAGSFYDPNSLVRDNELIAPDTPNFFYTDAIGEQACKFIDEHSSSRPFFLYVAFTAPHWPLHARPARVAKYQGTYDQGWDEVRKQRYQRMIDMGLVDPKWRLSPRDPKSPSWDQSELKAWNIRCMEVYAAMVDCLDQQVGQIVSALQRNDAFHKTMILFLADNGGCAENLGRQGEYQPRVVDPSELQPMQAGELQYKMIPDVTRDGFPLRQGRGVMPGPADTYIAYGLSWANASNTPFREFKHWVHEGGISTPFIAHWPAGTEAQRRGQLYHEPAHVIDIMATCVDVSGSSYPTSVDGQEICPPEGVSLRTGFEGKGLNRATPIFFEHEGNRAVRDGKWKLVAKGVQGPWELYDMVEDRSEITNLADQFPDRAAAMANQWEEWALRAKVKPWPYE